jgi:uncharacterized protein
MSARDGFPPGVPCWVETWQPDAAAAAAFYTALLGWTAVGPAGGPLMCKLRGRDVALIGERPSEHAGLPVAWTTYVWVASVDETAAKVIAAGGSVIIGPFDSLDGGRMVVFADPDGSLLAAWQPGAHRGAALVNEPGAWSWSQLLARDPERAKTFYGAVFGWATDTFGTGEHAVTLWRVPGYVGGEPEQPVSRDVVAGMSQMPPPGELGGGTPPLWQIDFWVDDVDATVARAIARGGRAVVPARDMPVARQAVLADPWGATFTVSRIIVRR